MPLNLSRTVICEVPCHRRLGSYVSSLLVCHIAAVNLLFVGPEVNAHFKSVNISGHLTLQ